MRKLATKAVVKLHDRQMQHNLQRDEAGLTTLADAGHAVGNACTTAASDPNHFCP
ncbi:MAG: hypothetical protein O7A71_03155 [Chloroflexi bacterium]|nr:hypothetical protein [Chloroflexota bacterium]